MRNEGMLSGIPKFVNSFGISFPLLSLSVLMLSSLLTVISRAFRHAAQVFAIKALFLVDLLAQILLGPPQKGTEGNFGLVMDWSRRYQRRRVQKAISDWSRISHGDTSAEKELMRGSNAEQFGTHVVVMNGCNGMMKQLFEFSLALEPEKESPYDASCTGVPLIHLLFNC